MLYLAATQQIPNIQYRHFLKKYYDANYCKKVADALGWTVDITPEQQQQNCIDNIGVSFKITIDEKALESIAPIRMEVNYNHFGKFAEIVKNIDSNPLATQKDCFEFLLNDGVFEPMLELLKFFDVKLNARRMSIFMTLWQWFGTEFMLLLRIYASEHTRMKFKQQLQV